MEDQTSAQWDAEMAEKVQLRATDECMLELGVDLAELTPVEVAALYVAVRRVVGREERGQMAKRLLTKLGHPNSLAVVAMMRRAMRQLADQAGV